MKTLGCRKSDEEGGSEEGKSAFFRIRVYELCCIDVTYVPTTLGFVLLACSELVLDRWGDRTAASSSEEGRDPEATRELTRERKCFGVYPAAVSSQFLPGLFDSILWLFEKNSLCSDRREGVSLPGEGLRVGARGLDNVRSSSPLSWLWIFNLYLKCSFFLHYIIMTGF